MLTNKLSVPPKSVWAYGYKIVPPQSEERLASIKRLLDGEHSDAKLSARTWRGKVVLEEKVTHILVVSDSAQQDRDINRKLEAELKALKVGFSITAAMAIADDDPPRAASAGLTHSPNGIKEQKK